MHELRLSNTYYNYEYAYENILLNIIAWAKKGGALLDFWKMARLVVMVASIILTIAGQEQHET